MVCIYHRLVTFARFPCTFSEFGWAWDRIPVAHRENVPTAEFVQSLVVFLHDVSSTWMERFEAKPGDPHAALRFSTFQSL